MHNSQCDPYTVASRLETEIRFKILIYVFICLFHFSRIVIEVNGADRINTFKIIIVELNIVQPVLVV